MNSVCRKQGSINERRDSSEANVRTPFMPSGVASRRHRGGRNDAQTAKEPHGQFYELDDSGSSCMAVSAWSGRSSAAVAFWRIVLARRRSWRLRMAPR